jgi:hypothetical protein
MAFRPEEFVQRGEIDNRNRGLVTGRIWFAGRGEPIELNLEGNAWRDLAGRRLEFVNPDPVEGDTSRLTRDQTGVIGDCTASRKVKVPEVPLDQIADYYRTEKPLPWHWGNSLYLEWFSQTSGRVVIEAANYKLTITDGPVWEMTEEEETAQRSANRDALVDFMRRLGVEMIPVVENPLVSEDKASAPDEEGSEEAASQEENADDADADADDPESAESDQADDEDEDDEEADDEDDTDATPGRPLTEAEAEALEEEGERILDRIRARVRKEGDAVDLGKIVDEELQRRREELGGGPLSIEEEAQRTEFIEEINRAAQELGAVDVSAVGGDDDADDADDEDADEADDETDEDAGDDEDLAGEEEEVEESHPLVERTYQLVRRMYRAIVAGKWLPDGVTIEHPVFELINATSQASNRLGAALDDEEDWPPPLETCANNLVRLKRASEYLEYAITAGDDCVEQKLVDPTWMFGVRQELVALRASCEELIAELRAMLAPFERGDTE